jgi:hypothetical protein
MFYGENNLHDHASRDTFNRFAVDATESSGDSTPSDAFCWVDLRFTCTPFKTGFFFCAICTPTKGFPCREGCGCGFDSGSLLECAATALLELKISQTFFVHE